MGDGQQQQTSPAFEERAGAAICFVGGDEDTCKLMIRECQFIACCAYMGRGPTEGDNGGAVFASNAARDSRYEYNEAFQCEARGGGGALNVQLVWHFVILCSSFAQCDCDFWGGAVRVATRDVAGEGQFGEAPLSQCNWSLCSSGYGAGSLDVAHETRWWMEYSMFSGSQSCRLNQDKGIGVVSNTYGSVLTATGCIWLYNNGEDALLSTDKGYFNISNCGFLGAGVVYMSPLQQLIPEEFIVQNCVFLGPIPWLNQSWMIDLGGHRNDTVVLQLPLCSAGGWMERSEGPPVTARPMGSVLEPAASGEADVLGSGVLGGSANVSATRCLPGTGMVNGTVLPSKTRIAFPSSDGGGEFSICG
jgi:hypothetical protein